MIEYTITNFLIYVTIVSMSVYRNLISDYYKKNKIQLIIYFLLMFIIYPTESIIIPKSLSNVINSIKFNQKTNSSDTIFYIKVLSIIVILAIILNWIKNSIENYHVPSYLSFIRRRMFKKTIHSGNENFKEVQSGKIISKIFEVSKYFKDMMHFFLSELGPIFITLSVVCIYYLKINSKLGCILIISLILVFMIMYIYSKKLIKISSDREKEYGILFEKINENFLNLFNIYINNQGDNEISKFYKIEKKYTDIYIEQQNLTNKACTLARFILAINYILIIYIGYGLYKISKINSHQYLTVLFILTYFVANVESLIRYAPRICITLGVLDNSSNFLKEIFTDENKRHKKNKITNGSIEFNKIKFKYPGTSYYIYKDFSLSINSGKFTAIIGRSGSGKSSIAKLLVKINKIEKGIIKIDGINIADFNTVYLRKHINYINQKTHLFNETVLYNLAYGNNASEDYIIKLLKKYELLEIYNGLEKNIHNKAGVNGSNLSLGMQKITILIRGLLRKASIYIIDEPLAGLDKNTRSKVLKLIKDRCANKTTIIITHDKEILSISNDVVYLDKIKK